MPQSFLNHGLVVGKTYRWLKTNATPRAPALGLVLRLQDGATPPPSAPEAWNQISSATFFTAKEYYTLGPMPNKVPHVVDLPPFIVEEVYRLPSNKDPNDFTLIVRGRSTTAPETFYLVLPFEERAVFEEVS